MKLLDLTVKIENTFPYMPIFAIVCKSYKMATNPFKLPFWVTDFYIYVLKLMNIWFSGFSLKNYGSVLVTAFARQVAWRIHFNTGMLKKNYINLYNTTMEFYIIYIVGFLR